MRFAPLVRYFEEEVPFGGHVGERIEEIEPGWFPTKMSRGLMERFEEEMLGGVPLGSWTAARRPGEWRASAS